MSEQEIRQKYKFVLKNFGVIKTVSIYRVASTKRIGYIEGTHKNGKWIFSGQGANKELQAEAKRRLVNFIKDFH